jgi:hypothetical protein
MVSFHESMLEYKAQLQKGIIQNAYRGLMEYMGSLRSHFKSKYPDYAVTGNIYFGYMDMTYFALNPPFLKTRKLRVALVFLHEEFRFEVWLAGYNKSIQKKYWDIIRKNGWEKYRIPSSLEGIDSIIEHILVENPDFRDLDALTRHFDRGIMKFIEDVEDFFEQRAL